MPVNILMPALSPTMDKGNLAKWLKREGDKVKAGDVIAEIETDKATMEYEAIDDGVLAKIVVPEGTQDVPVNQLIAILSQDGEDPKTIVAAVTAVSAPKAAPQAVAEAETPMEEPGPKSNVAVAASPSIRKLARELGLDLTRVRGSAEGGRIVIEDVRAYIQRLQKLAAQPKAAAGEAPKPVAESVDFSKWGSVTKQPLSPLRKVISRRMVENWNAIPHVTQFDDADITALLPLRKKYLEAYEKKGARLTVTCFVLKAVADTLKKYPIFNSSLDEAAQEIVLKNYIHIGIAVDTEFGLIVPVIRDVDKKDLVTLARELESLATKARERKVSGDELKGGTFTISNQGGIGGAHFTPIVNKPEVAILGLGRAAAKPVVREGKVEIRTLMPIGLSYDHRVIDGGIAARFTVDLLKAIEGFDEKAVKL